MVKEVKLKKRIVIIAVLILYVFSGTAVNAQISEFPLIYTEEIEDGGLISSYPVLDENNTLHSFILLQTDRKKIIHHYVENNITHQSLFASNFREIEFMDSFLFNGSFYLFYREYTFSSLTHFKLYSWSLENETTTIVASYSDFELYAIRFTRSQFINNSFHFYLTHLYGVEYVFMNVTHYSGLNSFTSEEFFIANYFQKEVVDIIMDSNGVLWYLFQEWNSPPTYLGILRYLGIGKLENEALTYVTNSLFEGITYQVERFVTFLENKDIFSVLFFHANTIYYGTFNGSNINYETQELKLNYFIDNFILRYTENLTKVCLVAKLGISNFVYFYNGYYNNQTFRWEFNSVSTQFQALDNTYGFDSNDDNYVIQYVSVITSSIVESPKGYDYVQENLMVLMTKTSLEVVPEVIFEDTELYNVFRYWLSENIVFFTLSIIASAAIVVVVILILRRKIPKAMKFLTDKEEYGKLPFAILVYKNSLRYIGNAFETFKMIGFTNKKRTILTIFSLLITGFLLNSFLIISESQQPAMINSFYEAQDLTDNRVVTAELTTAIEHLEDSSSDFSPLYHQLAEDELVQIYSNLEIGKYVESVTSTYTVMLGISGNLHRQMTSIPNDTTEIITNILVEGRAPVNSNEIVVSTAIEHGLGLNLNDTFNLTISSIEQSAEVIGNFSMEVTVVGFFSLPTSTELKTLTDYYGQHYDLFRKIRMANLLTTNDILFQLFSSSNRFELMIQGFYQIDFDFTDFQIKDRIPLLNEQRTIVNKTYTFPFDSSSSIIITEEMMWLLGYFNSYYMQNMARIIFFACPALLLSVFMVIESSDLFSTSYEQEVDILRKKGLRRMKIANLFLSVRMVEAFIATTISFGIAVLTSIPLIRIEGFLSFSNEKTKLLLSNVFLKLLIVFGVLIVISVPKIVSIASARRKYEKDPKKVVNLIKKLPYRDLAVLIPGIILFQIFYNRTIVALYTQDLSQYIVNLMLTLLGALFLIVGGLPIFIKILSIVWRFLGYILWNTRKNKITYIFAEISKDIKYFENITVIFLMVIIIVIPSIAIPYTKEEVLTNQAFFQNGSDLMINDWNLVENLTQAEINDLAQVKNSANLRLYTVLYGALADLQILVINKTDFINTIYEPSNDLMEFNWTELQQLENDTVIISNTTIAEFGIIPEDYVTFTRVIDSQIVSHSALILSSFSLFPVYHSERDSSRSNTLMIVSSECFDLIQLLTPGMVLTSDVLMVRLNDLKYLDEMKEELYQMSQKKVISYVDVRESLKTPLYSIFIMEIFLSLGVASVIFIFSSYTTATKVIEKRVIKHELMKKTGLKANTIVNLTLVESSLAAMIPGLGIGTALGNSVLKRLLSLLAYGKEPFTKYTIVYPTNAIIIVFVLIPIILYLSLNWNLRREFRRYAPTQME